LWGFLGYEGLTNQGFGYIMHAGYGDRKVWEVWGWEVWPPEDYDAIYKIAQSPTILHFPPPRPNIKNISKNYILLKKEFIGDILI
jgi:hypothetical protein